MGARLTNVQRQILTNVAAGRAAGYGVSEPHKPIVQLVRRGLLTMAVNEDLKLVPHRLTAAGWDAVQVVS
jgi:hypothetical protein